MTFISSQSPTIPLASMLQPAAARGHRLDGVSPRGHDRSSWTRHGLVAAVFAHSVSVTKLRCENLTQVGEE
jgi:hypothetical protein